MKAPISIVARNIHPYQSCIERMPSVVKCHGKTMMESQQSCWDLDERRQLERPSMTDIPRKGDAIPCRVRVGIFNLIHPPSCGDPMQRGAPSVGAEFAASGSVGAATARCPMALLPRGSSPGQLGPGTSGVRLKCAKTSLTTDVSEEPSICS